MQKTILKILNVAIVCLLCTSTIAQQNKNSSALKRLAVGDRLPDVSLGTIINNKGVVKKEFNGYTRFFELKGKLVVLDFWTSYCSSCIAGFKELSDLQKEYDGKIQIFLVNIYENEKTIINWLKKGEARGFRPVPSNLTILADSEALKALFPSNGEIGYHVWLDSAGKMILRGIHENTNKEKLESYFAGEAFGFVKDNALAYKPEISYTIQIKPSVAEKQLYSTYFGKFNDELASAYGAVGLNVVDSAVNNRRNTFLNLPVIELYRAALKNKPLADSALVFGRRIVLDVHDVSQFTSDPQWTGKMLSDNGMRKSGYCYEQVLSADIPQEQAMDYMLDDLNRFFGVQLKSKGNLETRRRKCYKITRVGNAVFEERPAIRSVRMKSAKDGKMYQAFEGMAMGDIFRSYLEYCDFFNPEDLVLDATGVNFPIDLNLKPRLQVKTIDQFKEELRTHNLQLVEGEEPITLFTIKQN